MNDVMRVLVCESPGTLSYGERKKPAFGKGESLVRIHRVGICGTDLHAFKGVQPYFQYPRVLGHELAAEFIGGDGTVFTPGQQVTILPYINCNSCIACRSGKPNCCVSMKVCGVHVDGGMAEYLVVPSDSVIDGGGLGLNELALVEPLAIGLHAIRRAGVVKDEFVLVIGAGPIGLGIIEFATLLGAKVIVMDVNEHRLDFCRRHFRAAHIINPSNTNARDQLQHLTDGDMPTVVLDATGNLNAIAGAFEFMSHGGRFILVGLQKSMISFSHPEFHKREGTLMSSRNATKSDFEFVIENIKSRTINAGKLITDTISFSQVADEFPTLADPARGVVKAVINMVED